MVDKKIIFVDGAKHTKMLALSAHLKQIFTTSIANEETYIFPRKMEHARLILASASLRALFFDENPILISFLKENDMEFEIESIESTLNLFLLSVFVDGDTHVSDYFAGLIIDTNLKNNHPINEKQQAFTFYDGENHFEKIEESPNIWRISPEEDNDEINSGMSISNNGTPSQMFFVTRKSTSIFDWGNVTIGYLKNIAITRKNIITFVANKLGGVHYDSSRLPATKEEKNKFKILSTAYDWNNKSIMNAGLVAIGQSCIEIASSSFAFGLMRESEKFYKFRLDRLLKERSADKKPPA